MWKQFTFLAIMLACRLLFSGESAGIVALEKITEKSERLESLLANRTELSRYSGALREYLGERADACSRADSVFRQGLDLAERVKGFKDIAWKISANENYDFNFAGILGAVEIHRVVRPFNAMMLFGHPTDCGVPICNSRDVLLADQWTMALLGAKLYVVEYKGRYTGAQIALVPVTKSDKKYLMVVPMDPGGVLKRMSVKEDALAKILQRVVGSKSYLGNLAILQQVQGASRFMVHSLSSQGKSEQAIDAAEKFQLADPLAKEILAVAPRHCKDSGRRGEGDSEVAAVGGEAGTPVATGEQKSLSIGKETKESSESKKESSTTTVPGKGGDTVGGPGPVAQGKPDTRVGEQGSRGIPDNTVGPGRPGGIGGSGDEGEMYGEIPYKNKNSVGNSGSGGGSFPNMGGRGVASVPAGASASGGTTFSGGAKSGLGGRSGNSGADGGGAGSGGTNITFSDQLGGGTGARGLGNLGESPGTEGKGSARSGGNAVDNGKDDKGRIGLDPEKGKRGGEEKVPMSNLEKQIMKVERYKWNEDIDQDTAKGLMKSIVKGLRDSPSPDLENRAIEAAARAYIRGNDKTEAVKDLQDLFKADSGTRQIAEKVAKRIDDKICCYCLSCAGCDESSRRNCGVPQ